MSRRGAVGAVSLLAARAPGIYLDVKLLAVLGQCARGRPRRPHPSGSPGDHAEEPRDSGVLQRLCQAGKAKKLALTACMWRLLTILNAMLKSGTPWWVVASQPA